MRQLLLVLLLVGCDDTPSAPSAFDREWKNELVRLKSGGPCMTVIYPMFNSICVEWIDHFGALQKSCFYPHQLERGCQK